MSDKDSLDLSWFYDSEQYDHSTIKDFSPTEIARRPWKAFWPPRSEDNLNFWLRSEFPEVLSWQFDHSRPFDQPWREWLRSLLMKVEAGSCRKKFTSKIVNQVDSSDSDLDTSSTTATDVSDLDTGLPEVQSATITYLAPLELYKTQKPYFSQLPCGTSLPRTNLVESDHLVDVHDIGGKEDTFKLDETGFQFIHLPTNISDWTEEKVQSEYLPEISAWLKEYLECKKVFVYNYNLRTNDTTKSGYGTWRSPIFRVHCDNTPESCAKRLEFQFPTEVAMIKNGRYRYIDVWRCIAGTNADAPLAVCDYRSMTPSDLHRIDIVYPHFSEEGFEVTYNPAHRWFYKKEMSKDDIVLFKIDDNLEGVAKFAPHTAFIDPSASGDTKRASIEIRAIILG